MDRTPKKGWTLGKIMECPICLEIYTQPKVLPMCQHSFCLQCIYRTYVEHLTNNGCIDRILCPVCKTAVFLDALPDRSLTTDEINGQLPNNLTLIAMIDWRRRHRHRKQRKQLHRGGRVKSAEHVSSQAPPDVGRDGLCPLAVSEPTSPAESPSDSSSASMRCLMCEGCGTWCCVSCDHILCDLCLPLHLDDDDREDADMQHEMHNIQEQQQKFRGVERSHSACSSTGKRDAAGGEGRRSLRKSERNLSTSRQFLSVDAPHCWPGNSPTSGRAFLSAEQSGEEDDDSTVDYRQRQRRRPLRSLSSTSPSSSSAALNRRLTAESGQRAAATTIVQSPLSPARRPSLRLNYSRRRNEGVHAASNELSLQVNHRLASSVLQPPSLSIEITDASPTE